MKTLDSFDPYTGIRTTAELDPGTNRFVIKHRSDLTNHLEYTRRLRNDDDYSKQGIKNGFWHCASIPPLVVVELLKIGVDVYGKSSPAEIIAGLKKLGKEHFITTTKRVA